MNDPVVFATSSLMEADMAAGLLEEHRFPFYRSVEAGGVRHAMPVAPADQAGAQWLIHVPAEQREEAERLLSSIPLGVAPTSARRPGLLLLIAAAIVILLPPLSWCTAAIRR